MRRLVLVTALALSACRVGVDFNEGRGYACSLDAGAAQCALGWRCGLEGFCHREGDAKPWQCEDSRSCEAGWVCGLERVCHDPSIAAAYLCIDDTACAGGWRCGFDGRCVDPRLEVAPVPELAAQGAEVLAPRLDLRLDARPAFVSTVGGVRVVIARGSAVDVLSPAGSDLLTTRVLHLDAGAPVQAVASLGANTWAQTAGEIVRWDEQGRELRQLALDGGPAALRVGSEPYLLQSGQLSRLPAYSGAVSHQLDSAAFDATVLGPCLFQLTSEGLFSANLAATGWSALDLEGPLANVACSQGRERYGISTGHFRVNANGLLTVAAVPSPRRGPPRFVDAGEVDENEISLYDATGLLAATATASACDTEPPTGLDRCGSPRTTTLLGPCRSPCMFGQLVSDVRARRSPAGVELEVECSGARGQSTWRVSGVGTECAASLLSGSSTRYVEVRRAGFDSTDFSQVMQFGEHGQVWVGATFSRAAAIFLDEVPLGPARLSQADGGRVTGWVASESLAVPNPELGLLNIPGPGFAAVVQGTDDWAVDDNGLLVRLDESWRGGALELVGALDVRADAFKPPIAAQRVGLDGGMLIVTVNDAVYAAPADPLLLAASDVPLRVVPQPGVAITSLAVMPFDADAGSGLRGYLSTRTSVMSFTTRGTSWSVQPVTTPPGTVREVWVDAEGHARAGFDDGRVVTLPSRIPVAPVIVGDSVVDYLSACGQTWALTTTGLLRLTSGAGGAGEWVDWPLTGAETVVLDGLDEGRLFASNGNIYVFNAFGNAVSFAPPGCR